MKKKVTVEIGKETALDWYRGGCMSLRKAAIEAYTETELKEYEWNKTLTENMTECKCLNTSRDNVERIEAINKVLVVESVLNKGWEGKRGDTVFTFENYDGIKIVATRKDILPLIASFKSVEDAERALNILGSHTISVAMGIKL